MYKKRHIEYKTNRLLEMFPVVAIIGARQCGKSTFVKNLRPQWKYYDLESPDHYQLISNDPVSFFNINDRDLIINEAQQYPDLFKVLRGIIDQKHQQKGRFILTGSSSRAIVNGITESLAGRIAIIEMSPFTQSELHEVTSSPLYSLISNTSSKASNFKSLHPQVSLTQSMQAWLKGGFPEPAISVKGQPDYIEPAHKAESPNDHRWSRGDKYDTCIAAAGEKQAKTSLIQSVAGLFLSPKKCFSSTSRFITRKMLLIHDMLVLARLARM